MSNEDFVAYGLAAAGITAIVIQLLNDLWVSSSPLSQTQRAALLRGLNYLINMGLILLAVMVRGAFSTQDLFVYLAMAFGQSLGSHTGWSLISNGSTSGGGRLSMTFSSARLRATAAPSTDPGTPETLESLPTIPRNS